ncbi:MAG: TrkA family potassium uptake protein [Deltaproteobacteria bacterium]|nr:TrkA family potassium uptake protein [Deltaproteobacteria bacterium]
MKQFAIIGLGDFGFNVVEALSKGEAQIIAVDSDPAKVAKVKDMATNALQLDSTNEEALLEAGIPEVDAAVICIGRNLQDNILTTAILKRLGVSEIIVRASSILHEQILREIGATRVVNPEKDLGIRIGRQLLFSKLEDSVDLAQGYVLADVKIPKQFIGKTLGEIQLRKKYRLNVIAIKKTKKLGRRAGDQSVVQEYNSLPEANDVLDSECLLVVVGQKEDIDRIINLD